jgi:hypothetical protein
MAAQRMLRAIENPDLADFQDVIEGDKSLRELKRAGVNTAVIKKMKTKTKTYQNGETPVTEVEREIELHDRSGSDVDRIVHNTDGSPSQAVKVEGFIPIGVVRVITPALRAESVSPPALEASDESA